MSRVPLCALVLGMAMTMCPGLAASADNPFEGDYAARYTSTPAEGEPRAGTQGLLVIAITAEGRLSASYINKTANINYHVKGTIDNDGRFEGKVFFEGKEWGRIKEPSPRGPAGTSRQDSTRLPTKESRRGAPYPLLGARTLEKRSEGLR